MHTCVRWARQQMAISVLRKLRKEDILDWITAYIEGNSVFQEKKRKNKIKK